MDLPSSLVEAAGVGPFGDGSAKADWRLEHVQALKQKFAAAFTPAQVADAVVWHGLPTLGAAAGTVALYDPQRRVVRLLSPSGYPEETLSSWGELPVDTEVPLCEAIRLQKPILLESREETLQRYPALGKSLRAPHYEAQAIVPLVFDDELIGALAFSFPRPRAFTDRDRGLLVALAAQSAVALWRTQRYEAEREARRAAERAQALAEEALRARDEALLTLEDHRALAASETAAALDALVEGISHEIRTPLTAIQNNAFLLQIKLDQVVAGTAARETGAETVRLAAKIVRGVDRLAGVVKQLRRFSGIDASERAPGDLAAVVEEAVELFTSTSDRDVPVTLQVTPAPEVSLDRPLMQQVVLNLLANSSDALLDREGEIRVSVGPDAGTDAVVLTVADDGCGIPDEMREHIYSPLFTTKPDGPGLGLSIVKRIVESHGGRIACASTPGTGTTFTVSLPRAPASRSPSDLPDPNTP